MKKRNKEVQLLALIVVGIAISWWLWATSKTLAIILLILFVGASILSYFLDK